MMLELNLAKDDRTPLKVLVLGSHSDDIEIGAGGTVLTLLGGERPLDVKWVVFSATGQRAPEAASSAAAFLQGATTSDVVLHAFRDGYFPHHGAEIKDRFEELKSQFDPDLILTHHSADCHQDHRVICELTWNSFRNHLILEYEIPKYDGDLGQPNLFVPIDRQVCDRKCDLLLDHFKSQTGKHWFTKDTFLALMRLRGLEANSPTLFAEAFHARKLTLR
jgi:LmbE family N-acetylglucosaminyl deacetylase